MAAADNLSTGQFRRPGFDPRFDIPTSEHLSEEQHERLMSADIDDLGEVGTLSYKGRQRRRTLRGFDDLKYYQDPY